LTQRATARSKSIQWGNKYAVIYQVKYVPLPDPPTSIQKSGHGSAAQRAGRATKLDSLRAILLKTFDIRCDGCDIEIYDLVSLHGSRTFVSVSMLKHSSNLPASTDFISLPHIDTRNEFPHSSTDFQTSYHGGVCYQLTASHVYDNGTYTLDPEEADEKDDDDGPIYGFSDLEGDDEVESEAGIEAERVSRKGSMTSK
jgi:hypothetical protein